jgi:alpha-mannosidase
VFPTPEAQCLGEHTAELMLIPHAGDGAANGAFEEAYAFQVPWTAAQTGVHEGELAPVQSVLTWEGEGLAFSSMKIGEEDGSLMLRWFNLRPQASKLTLRTKDAVTLYKSDVLERQGPAIAGADASGASTVPVGPCEILTIGAK